MQGRDLAYVVSHRVLTEEARVKSQSSPIEMYGAEIGTGSRYKDALVLPRQCHSASIPYLFFCPTKFVQ